MASANLDLVRSIYAACPVGRGYPSNDRETTMEHLSDKPFGEALRTLMNERGLTYRSLAEETRALDGKGMSHAHLNMLANGHEKPTMARDSADRARL